MGDAKRYALLTAVSGRLGYKPKKESSINKEPGAAVEYASAVLYIFDPSGKDLGDGKKEDMAVPILAFSENAEILGCKEKGDVITFAGKLRYLNTGKNEKSLGFLISKFDGDHAIAKKQSDTLSDFISGGQGFI